MRILVTGASGLLGLNLALEASQKHEVFGSVYSHEIASEHFTVIQTDLLAKGAIEALLDRSQPEWVINCAALADLEACEADPVLAGKLNIELPRNLAECVARGGARLVHISTDAVFDGIRGNYREEDAPNPLSTYARSKLAGESEVMEHDPQAIVARVNLFGWSLSGKRSLAEWFINNLFAGKQMRGFTDVYFCPLLANDLAKVLFEMLARGLRGLYHVVARDCATKYKFGVRLAELFGMDGDLILPASLAEACLEAARSPNLTLITEKLSTDLRVPPPDLESGLLSFYNQHLSGYREKIKNMGAVHNI
jgi:dTDP-4-dehydrorhamnose reductase